MNDFYLDAAEKYNEISAVMQEAMWTAGKAYEAPPVKQPPSWTAADASKWKEADSERGGEGNVLYFDFFLETFTEGATLIKPFLCGLILGVAHIILFAPIVHAINP